MVTFDARAPGTSAAAWDAATGRNSVLDAGLDGLPALDPPTGRTIVVAAHPDDETLGAAGLIRRLWCSGNPAEVVIVSDGAASHPGSPTTPPAALAAIRAAEAQKAAEHLSPGLRPLLLGYPDGGLAESRAAITEDLRTVVTRILSTVPNRAPSTRTDPGDGSLTIVAPWRGDGHRDHRVTGEICAELAAEHGATLLEYPIWMWHWATPDDGSVPWARMRQLRLHPAELAAKERAIAAHASQTAQLSEAPADAPPLAPAFLEHFDRPREVFVTSLDGQRQALDEAYFAAAYARRADPWGFTTRWYEERKRAVTLAVLPEKHYRRVLELGCSVGVLTEALAARSDRLLATDIADSAVRAARSRTADHPQVEVRRHDLAEGIPSGGPFDLVVVSEVGYYLTRPGLARFARRLVDHLADGGTVVACHWRYRVPDYPLTGDAVHAILAEHLVGHAGLTRLVEHRESDFLLDVWSTDRRSVAARTGLA